jgi:hypothetical protein
MTEGFPVHPPDDHEVEHATHHGGSDPFAGCIAVMTAMFVTVALVVSALAFAHI